MLVTLARMNVSGIGLPTITGDVARRPEIDMKDIARRGSRGAKRRR